MSEREQNKPLGPLGRGIRCDECENLIADALDGTLSAADAAAFTRHQNECPLCAQILKETQQGKSWMEYLAVEPEVPADLLHIPMGQVPDRLTELDPQKETVVICRSGGRSLQVADFLEAQGFASVYNLTGGILAWSRNVDPKIPQY